ncbi:MAG: hypothetical protein WCG27_03570 [Pseudomonadota bacterium]
MTSTKSVSRKEFEDFFNQTLRPWEFDDLCSNGLPVEGFEDIRREASDQHQFEFPEDGVALYLCGHRASETLGVLALGELLKKKFRPDCFFIPTDNPL